MRGKRRAALRSCRSSGVAGGGVRKEENRKQKREVRRSIFLPPDKQWLRIEFRPARNGAFGGDGNYRTNGGKSILQLLNSCNS
jgi:hypothetical protein